MFIFGVTVVLYFIKILSCSRNSDFPFDEYKIRDVGTGGGGGRRGNRPRCPLPGGARGAKVPFQFKGLPLRNSELSEMLVQLFYEFASEDARNAVIELQE